MKSRTSKRFAVAVATAVIAWTAAGRADLLPATSGPSGMVAADASSVGGTGAFEWNYSFDLPEARGEYQPSLGISYSGSPNDGTAGLGMDVEWPSIARASLSGFPDFATPPSDALFQAGGSKLIYLGDSTSVAWPGGRATPVEARGGLAFIDQIGNSQKRYVFFPAQERWIVLLPDGGRQEFGRPLTAPTLSTDPYAGLDLDDRDRDSSGTPVAARWHLTRTLDRSGNIVAYTYETTGLPGGAHRSYLSSILSTPKTTGATSADYANMVLVEWQSGAGSGSPTAHADRRVTSRVLKRVMVYVEGQSVRTYAPEYFAPKSVSPQRADLAPLYGHMVLHTVSEYGPCTDFSPEHIARFSRPDGLCNFRAPVRLEYSRAFPSAFGSQTSAPTVLPATATTGNTVELIPGFNNGWEEFPEYFGLNQTYAKFPERPPLGYGSYVQSYNEVGAAHVSALARGEPFGVTIRYPVAPVSLQSDLQSTQWNPWFGTKYLLNDVNHDGTPDVLMNRFYGSRGAALAWYQVTAQATGGLKFSERCAESDGSHPYGIWTQTSLHAFGEWPNAAFVWQDGTAYRPSLVTPNACARFSAQPVLTWTSSRAALSPALLDATPATEGTWIVDVDGDGLPDRLSRPDASHTWRSQAIMAATVEFSRRTDDLSGAKVTPFVPNDPSRPPMGIKPIHMYSGVSDDDRNSHFFYADMDNDGLTDFVYSPRAAASDIRAGAVLQWYPGDGRGTFSCAPGNCAPRAPSSTSSAPGYTALTSLTGPLGRFEQDLTSGAPTTFTALHDVNGDGYPDGVTMHDGVLHVYFRQATGGFGCSDNVNDECVLAKLVTPPNASFPGVALNDAYAQLQFGDMNGDGVDEIVVTSPFGFYVQSAISAVADQDGLAASRPGLLTHVFDDRGSSTHVTYRSLQQMAQDRIRDQRPWSYVSTAHADLAVRIDRTSPMDGSGITQSTTDVIDYEGPGFSPWTHGLIGFEQKTTHRLGQPVRVTTTSVLPDCSRSILSLALEGDMYSPPANVAICKRIETFAGSGPPSDWIGAAGRPSQILSWVPAMPDVPAGAAGAKYGVIPISRTDYKYTDADGRISSATGGEAPRRRQYWLQLLAKRSYSFDVDAPSPVTAMSINGALALGPLAFPTVLASLGTTTSDEGGAVVLDERSTLQRSPSGTENATLVSRTTFTYEAPRANGVRVLATKTVLNPGTPDATRQWRYTSDSVGRMLRAERAVDANTGGTFTRDDVTQPHAPLPASRGAEVADSGGTWALELERTFDAYGNLTSIRGGGVVSPCQRLTYDSSLHFYPTQLVTAPDCTAAGQVTTLTWNPQLQAVAMAVDARGAVHSTAYDAMGRPVSVTGPDATGVPVVLQTMRYAPVANFDLTYVTTLRPSASTGDITTTIVATPGGGTFATFAPNEGEGYRVSFPASLNSAGLVSRTHSHPAVTGVSPTSLATQPSKALPILASEPSYEVPLRDRFGRTFGVDETVGTVTRPKARQRFFRQIAGELETVVETKTGEALVRASTAVGAQATFTTDLTRTHTNARGQTTSTEFVPGTGPDEYDATTFFYNPFNEVTRTVRSFHQGAQTKYVERYFLRDSAGRVVSTTEPHATDGLTAAGLHRYDYRFDHAGRLLATRDPRGCGANFHYDGYGRQIAVDASPCTSDQLPYTAPDLTTGNGTEAFAAFAGPDLDWTADRGVLRKLTTNLRGEVIKDREALAIKDSATLTNRYSPLFAQVEATRDLDGTPLTSTLTPLIAFDGHATIDQSFTYKRSGGVSQINSTFGTLFTNPTYDAEYRLRSVARGAQTETWNFDGLGRMTDHASTDGSFGPQVLGDAFTYNTDNQITSQTSLLDASMWSPSDRPFAESFEYTGRGRLKAATRAYNGTVAPGSVPLAPEAAAGSRAPVPHTKPTTRPQRQQFAYAGDGSLQSAWDSYTVSDTSVSSNSTLATSPNGAPGQLAYNYGPTNSATETYDAAGNLTESRVTHNGTCQVGTASYCFQRFRYTWDEFGQLVRVRRWDAATPADLAYITDYSPTTVDVNFRYGAGRRVQKSVAVRVISSTFAAKPVLELQPLPGYFVRGATAPTTFKPENQEFYLSGLGHVYRDPTAAVTHLLDLFADTRGSFVGAVDRATGEIVERRSYTAYGVTEADYRASSFRERLGYNGQVEDPETDLIHLGARYYAPFLGRFISVDPLTVHAAAADPNPYAFTGGDPINFADPSGLNPCGSADGNCEVKDMNSRAEQGDSDEWNWGGMMANGGLSDEQRGRGHSDPVLSIDQYKDAEGQEVKHALNDVVVDRVTAMGDPTGLVGRVMRPIVRGLGVPKVRLKYGAPNDPHFAAIYHQQKLYAERTLMALEVVGTLGTAGAAVAGRTIAAEAVTTEVAAEVASEGTTIATEAAAEVVSEGAAGTVALDTNPLIGALKEGKAVAVDAAIAGRTPIIPITVAKEYIRHNGAAGTDAIRAFLQARGGRLAAAGTEASATALRTEAAALRRVVRLADSRIAASALREGVPLITNDGKLGNFLRATGRAVESW